MAPLHSPPRRSRAALLAGASLIALAALGPSGAAQAACTRPEQAITGSISGPVFSNGGAITISGTGEVIGGAEGVYAQNCGITTLSNSGLISAGTAGNRRADGGRSND